MNNIPRNVLRKNIIKMMIVENKKETLYYQRRLNRLLNSKEKFNYKRYHLNEGMMDMLGDAGGSLLKTLGGDIDSIKGYFISAMLDMLGIKDPQTKGVISNVLEQVGMDDITALMSGASGACQAVTEDVVAGLIEFALEDGLEKVVKYIDDLDIPLVDGLVQSYAGGEGMLATKEEEQLVNTITKNIYPVIGKKVEDFVCNLGFLGGEGESKGEFLGDQENPDAKGGEPDQDAAEETINEIFDYNIYHISQKLQRLSDTRKKLQFIQN